MNAPNLPRARRRTPLRRALVRPLSESRVLPEERPRRAPRLIPLQDPRRAQNCAHHQRHRASLPRGPPTHPTDGRVLGQNQHGPYPVRRLLPRKPQPRRQHPLPTDTFLLTSPAIREEISIGQLCGMVQRNPATSLNSLLGENGCSSVPFCLTTQEFCGGRLEGLRTATISSVPSSRGIGAAAVRPAKMRVWSA